MIKAKNDQIKKRKHEIFKTYRNKKKKKVKRTMHINRRENHCKPQRYGRKF